MKVHPLKVQAEFFIHRQHYRNNPYRKETFVYQVVRSIWLPERSRSGFSTAELLQEGDRDEFGVYVEELPAVIYPQSCG